MRRITKPATAGIAAVIAVVLAVSLAGPAFGGAHTVSSSASLTTAKKALRTAKVAKRLASRALTLAGPQGQAGKDGKNGLDGKNGTNGTNGTNGANGAPGPQGIQGPAGPTASGGASLDYQNGNNEKVLSSSDVRALGVGTSGTGPINVAVRSRLLATAMVDIRERTAASDPTLPPQASCHLEVAAANQAFSRIGQGEPTVFFSGALNDFKQVGVTGYADVDPGSYDVRVMCRQPGGTGTLGVRQADITAVASGL
jgi:hypothetical protein